MKNDKWTKTSKRFVAFFDIMGFKDLVQRNSHDYIVTKLETLKNVLNELETWDSENIETLKEFKIEKHQTKSITFSDSIVIFSMHDSIKDFHKILLDSCIIIRTAYEEGIGIKGALSFGEITVDFDKNIFFGQPIIDAFLLQEELALYTAILDNNIEAKQKSFEISKLQKNVIVSYKAPLKGGKVTHNLIMPIVKDDIELTIKNLKNCYLKVSGKPRMYVDNTIEFYEKLQL